jgi:hypothetical protein
MTLPASKEPMQIPAMLAQLAALRSAIEALTREVRELRGRRQEDEVQFSALLGANFRVFNGTEFTAAWLLEACLDADPDSQNLHHALMACVGQRPTIRKLARLLSRSTGRCGVWRLECTDHHSRDGAKYRVTK